MAALKAAREARERSEGATLARLCPPWHLEGLHDYLQYVVVAMGRYGRQDMEAVSRWPVSRVYRRWDQLRELLDRENYSPEDQ